MSPHLLALLLCAAPPSGALTLEEALRLARENQPALRQARASAEAAEARADEAGSALYPQVSAGASYQRATSNFVPRPGSVPKSVAGQDTGNSWASYNFYSSNVTASALLWDFGQTLDRARSARATAKAQSASAHTTQLAADYGGRTAFYAAAAQRALVEVAEANLTNSEAHLAQIQGFVEAGTRPEIDLAQARADRANARVSLISAKNNYATARARLNQSLGVEGPANYEVAPSEARAVVGEGEPLERLVDEALKDRPEAESLNQQQRAAELSIGSVRGGYYPSLSAQAQATAAGSSPTGLAPNASLQLALAWPLYQGGLTTAQEREARAQLVVVQAQLEALRLQVRLDVEQAQLALGAAQESLGAAGEAKEAAAERLRLAEGRYQAGVGSVIELGDAQVALAQASAQAVQADFNLATARAQLLQALGRDN